jgi:hypothetical protein
MKLYCEIEEIDGVKRVKRGPCQLPQNTSHISNFNTIIDLTVLKDNNWLPYRKSGDDKKIILSSNIIILDDVVHETVISRDETDEEVNEREWLIVRANRDALLKQTDVKVLADRWSLLTDTEKSEISTYRQQLRDIPQTFTRPQDVIWPTKI